MVSKNMKPYLVPLKEYYIVADNGLVKKMIYALSGIAFFILAMAVINFINMSVSRSATRMREIGIRKVLGSVRLQLVQQFLNESILLVFFATLFALAGYQLLKPFFASILGKDIPSLYDFPLHFLVFPLMLILVVGLVAGIYPAFYLSSLKSVESLKGKLPTLKENVLVRKLLVGFQFGTASLACIGALIISQQVRLFFSTNLGYDKEYIVSAQLPRNWSPEGVKRMAHMRQEFTTLPQVKEVTLSYEIPDGNNSGSSYIYKAGADSSTAISSQTLLSDEHYASAYNIPMAAGAFYNIPGTSVDSTKLVINETGAASLGWKDPREAIGKQIRFVGGGGLFTIAGVTKDFHFGSMQNAIQPETEKFHNDKEADAMLTREYRKPYIVPDKV